MEERGTTSTFVCPDWARDVWNPDECTIEPCTDGIYAVVDHSLNGVVIYVNLTQEDCESFLRGESFDAERFHLDTALILSQPPPVPTVQSLAAAWGARLKFVQP